jgi:hypothetical protein
LRLRRDLTIWGMLGGLRYLWQAGRFEKTEQCGTKGSR